MALDAANVRIARTGAVYVAPVGTALPTTTAAALNAAFEDCGYVSEDGVTFTPSETVTKIRAWQNNAVVATAYTRSPPSSCADDVRKMLGHCGHGLSSARSAGGCGRSSNWRTDAAP